MFKVLVDLERTKNMNCGLGQYCLHLGQALRAAGDREIEPHFLLPSSPPSSLPGVPASIRASRWRRESFQRFLRPWRLAATPRFDLWHATHQDTKFLPLDPRIPLVLTIHDLNFLRTKVRLSTIRRRLTRLQSKVNRATAITTASQHAAHDIRKHLDLRGKPITIIPHGVCLNAADNSGQRPAFLPAGKFLFAIGEVVAKKNFHVLADFMERVPDHRLVIAGSLTSDYAKRLVTDVQRRGLQDRVILPGTITNADRAWLFQNCSAFVFPSLSEGFGLPVIEAMHCGRPVFTSMATSLPEVGGELAFYWERFEPVYMAEIFRAGMRKVAAAADFPARLQAHAARFTWPSAARQYLDLYQQTLATATANRAA